MKKLFQAIRKNDIETVRALIQDDPALVNCVAKQPPKKDDGQSPLQIAFKSNCLDIAKYLIDAGANVNFIEDASCCNPWRAPVIHDAINAAIMNSRWNTNSELTGFQVFSTERNAKKAYSLLKKMLDLGADVNAADSYGNSGIWRFCSQASQILPSFGTDRIFTKELQEDLSNILHLLHKSGSDLSYKNPNINLSLWDLYKEGHLYELLKSVSK